MATAAYNGLLVIDKPGGMTSRDVVNRAQGWFPRGTRIGHTGTLDPLATGVLVLCVGAATRLAEYVQRMKKTYRAGLLLGARSDTDDADGVIKTTNVFEVPDRAELARCLEQFIGEVKQIPPIYSAAKVSGQRAYDRARQGQELSLEPRRVYIYGIDILGYEYPHVDLEVRCGKGTYIRALARDLGQRLGCGALVEKLRRTRVGPFEADHALNLTIDPSAARFSLLPLSAALVELPRVVVDESQIRQLQMGQGVPLEDPTVLAGDEHESPEAAVFDVTGELVAVARVDRANRKLLPTKVLSSSTRQN
jgi:tRNA pseudouridine55 synthase